MPLPPDSTALAQVLIDGLEKTFQNADELYSEAQLLCSVGAHARALLLHQISLEECGKADMLSGAIFELLRGGQVDVKRLSRAFTRHEVKNNANAYFLPMSDAEVQARKANDTGAAVVAFEELQEQFHGDSNRLKNASLYTDFSGTFTAPRDAVTTADTSEIAERNAEFLGITHHKLNVISRWKNDPNSGAEEVAQLSKALGMDVLDRKTPESIEGFMTSLEDKLRKLVEAQNSISVKGSTPNKLG